MSREDLPRRTRKKDKEMEMIEEKKEWLTERKSTEFKKKVQLLNQMIQKELIIVVGGKKGTTYYSLVHNKNS